MNKKECALAHSRAEARLLRQPSSPAPSAHPRGAFLYDRTQFPIIQKSTVTKEDFSHHSTHFLSKFISVRYCLLSAGLVPSVIETVRS